MSVATCRDAVGPRGTVLGRVAVAPILPSDAALAVFGLAIDRVRIVVVRPAADTLADTTVSLPPDATFLDLDLRVPLVSSPESLDDDRGAERHHPAVHGNGPAQRGGRGAAAG